MSEKTADVRKITRGFQVTLPRSFRERHGLKVGDVVEMVEINGVLSVQPIEIRRKPLQASLEDAFGQADAARAASLTASSEAEAMALAEREIKSHRQKKARRS